MRGAVLALVLVGCAQPAARSGHPGPALQAWLEAPGTAGGTLVVQLQVDADAEWDLDEPGARGLVFEPKGERVERLGDDVVLTQRWSYSGEDGTYEIPALRARYEGPDGEGILASSPIWVDLGDAPARDEELVDITEPPRVWTVPWGPVSVVGGLVLLLAGGVFLAFSGSGGEREQVVPRKPPHVRALEAWNRVRRDPTVSDHDKALAISRIFREYGEEVLAFPATAWTTSEIVTHLRDMAHLPEGNVPRAKRLLRATDRVKFADEEAREGLFDDLDSDLRAFLESTRPRAWVSEGAA